MLRKRHMVFSLAHKNSEVFYGLPTAALIPRLWKTRLAFPVPPCFHLVSARLLCFCDIFSHIQPSPPPCCRPAPVPLRPLLRKATDTVAVAGPSGASHPGSSLSLTLWRISGGAGAGASSASAPASAPPTPSFGGARSRTHGAGAAAGRPHGAAGAEPAATLAPRLSELHFLTLEGGAFVVPAPRAGLDRAPSGTVPALLPLFFPGLRAVAPPVQVKNRAKGQQHVCAGGCSWRTRV